MKAVGIGCYWFAYRGADDDAFSPFKHLENIKIALETVDNVSNVEIVGDGSTIQGASYRSDHVDEETNNFFPLFANVEINFDIFIPTRVQKRLALDKSIHGDVEAFHVDIMFDYGLPVAYVSYDLSDKSTDLQHHDPSLAVMFIREYLEEKLKNHPMVEFQCLGPSPFWVDIILKQTKDTDDEAMAKDLTPAGRGYRLLLFELPYEADALVDVFIVRNQEMLSTFYDVVRYKNISNRLAASIINAAKDLVNSSQGGLGLGLVAHMRRGRLIDATFDRILNEKMNQVSLAQYIGEKRSEGEIDEGSLFYKSLDRELSSRFEVPIDDIKELLKMLEDRRQKHFQIAATLSAGVIGAIFGATLTFALASTFGQSKANPSPPSSQTEPAARSGP